MYSKSILGSISLALPRSRRRPLILALFPSQGEAADTWDEDEEWDPGPEGECFVDPDEYAPMA